MNKLILLCLSALVATCIATSCGGVTCGNTADLCCGNRCYNNVTHDCIDGVLCGKGNGVCKGNVCYDPNFATCYPGYPNSTTDLLCGKGLSACGYGANAFCYDASNYYCLPLVTGPVIIGNAEAVYYCGSYRYSPNYACCIGRVTEAVYDPRISSCVFDEQGSGKASVCPFTPAGKPQKGCQADNIIPPTCYDPDFYMCCHRQHGNDASTNTGTILPVQRHCPGSGNKNN